MNTLLGMVRRWFGQDVARTNAARASVRLQHRRRQLRDVDAWLAAQHHQPARYDANGPSTKGVHIRHPRQT
jgi:hypothetical protein